MAVLFKNLTQLVLDIDSFISTVENGVLVFKEGILNYLDQDSESFSHKIKIIDRLENEADKLQQKIDDQFYLHSILPQNVSDIETMLDKVDEIIDGAKECLWRFDDEIPDIPEPLKNDFRKLTLAASETALAVFPAAKEFFRVPHVVREMLTKVYFYENEADQISRRLRRKIFREMKDMHLSQKNHLNFFALEIDSVSDKAETLADVLSILALKMSL
jgi:uncharacterized protein